MKCYLVTGAAGFIGANFVKYLIETYGNDVRIVILDALTYAGHLESIKDEIALPNVTFIKGDIGDFNLVSAIIKEHKPDYVVNFAAESHVDRSITGPRIFVETNILGTQTLLDAVREAWRCPDNSYLPGHRFLQISTDEVYGALTIDFTSPQPLQMNAEVSRVCSHRGNPETFGNALFNEHTPLSPRSPYSASKASADMLVMAYHETFGLPVSITRCSNNYGPYQFTEKLIPLIITNILKGKKLPVYGKGENVRDWLYVTDHARAIDLVLTKGKQGEVYNIGGLNEKQNISIVREIIATVSRLIAENPDYRHLSVLPAEDINESLIEFVTDRPGHDLRYAIDPTKIAGELGWVPQTPFSEGIRLTVKWYLDNPGWIESVTSKTSES
ncbi:MAG: dTDP-glucose 4,6-dehydratase [Muribaculaceae bacterium]|nr:dTDP-glucose 4,6-dehydratase [Muribaculaceae bacterium]